MNGTWLYRLPEKERHFVSGLGECLGSTLYQYRYEEVSPKISYILYQNFTKDIGIMGVGIIS